MPPGSASRPRSTGVKDSVARAFPPHNHRPSLLPHRHTRLDHPPPPTPHRPSQNRPPQPALHHPQRHRPRNPPHHPNHRTPPAETSHRLTHGHWDQHGVIVPSPKHTRPRTTSMASSAVGTDSSRTALMIGTSVVT